MTVSVSADGVVVTAARALLRCGLLSPPPPKRSDNRSPAVPGASSSAVSRFEQPRDIHIVGDIPRNPAGKVARTELSI